MIPFYIKNNKYMKINM